MNNNHHRRSAVSGHPLWFVPSILLAIVIVASPLAIGGVHWTTAAAIATTSLIGLWWALATGGDRDDSTGLVAFSIPTLGFGIMALGCLIQLIPVPSSIYRLLQPAGFEAWTTNAELVFGQAPQTGWHLLSLDPGATAEHGLKWLALSATAALAGQVITDRRRRRIWLGIVLLSGFVVAIAGTIQHISDTDLMLGLYEAELTPRSISAFVSTNHAATYYGLMALVGVAYGLDHLRRSPLHASLGASAAIVYLLLSATHSSRGALLAVAAGLVVFAIGAATRFSPGDDSSRKKLRLGILGVIAVATAGAFFFPGDWTVADDVPELEGTSAEVRIHMTGAALEAAGDHPVVGTGAGSVGRTLAPYIDWTELKGNEIPTIENEPGEWVMTLGPVIALIAIGLFLLVVARTAPHVIRRRGRRGPIAATAFLIFMGIVALFHFPFFTLGISVVAVVCFEACADRHRDPIFITSSRRWALVFALGLTVAVAGLSTARITVLSPGAEADLDVSELERVERALHLYPTDGRLMSALSLDAREADEQRALELARRAYELRPRPQQHLRLARSLAIAGNDREAAETYGELIDQDRHRSHYGTVANRLQYDIRDPELRALALADASPRDIRRFSRQIRQTEGRFPAIDFALELVELRPDRPTPHLELIELYQDAEQPLLAEVYARNLIGRDLEGPDGERPAGVMVLVELFDAQDRHDEALNLAHRTFDAGRATPELARLLLSMLPSHPDEVAAHHWTVIEAAVETGCRPPYERNERSTCWQSHALVAEANGELERAESLLRRIERHSSDPRQLADFLARHDRCRELAGLERRHEGERHHGRVERRLQECVNYE